jgi:hypothetical protein
MTMWTVTLDAICSTPPWIRTASYLHWRPNMLWRWTSLRCCGRLQRRGAEFPHGGTHAKTFLLSWDFLIYAILCIEICVSDGSAVHVGVLRLERLFDSEHDDLDKGMNRRRLSSNASTGSMIWKASSIVPVVPLTKPLCHMYVDFTLPVCTAELQIFYMCV